MDETTLSVAFPICKCWMKRGQQKRLPAPPGANAFQHVIGGLNWRTQAVSYTTATVKNSDPFIALVEAVVSGVYPTQSVVLVMDNAPYHRSREVQAALSVYGERVLVFWLPPYCPTLNPIERFWLHLKRTATANALFSLVQALLEAVRAVLSIQNQPHHPLRLTFSHV